jgi:hypothetical protein
LDPTPFIFLKINVLLTSVEFLTDNMRSPREPGSKSPEKPLCRRFPTGNSGDI